MKSTLVLLLAMLALPFHARAQEPAPACAQLGQAFQMVAQLREGLTRDQALELVDQASGGAATPDQLSAEDQTRMAIRQVYAHPQLTPDEIQRRVQAACSVDSEGKIQFDGL